MAFFTAIGVNYVTLVVCLCRCESKRCEVLQRLDDNIFFLGTYLLPSVRSCLCKLTRTLFLPASRTDSPTAPLCFPRLAQRELMAGPPKGHFLLSYRICLASSSCSQLLHLPSVPVRVTVTPRAMILSVTPKLSDLCRLPLRSAKPPPHSPRSDCAGRLLEHHLRWSLSSSFLTTSQFEGLSWAAVV